MKCLYGGLLAVPLSLNDLLGGKCCLKLEHSFLTLSFALRTGNRVISSETS